MINNTVSNSNTSFTQSINSKVTTQAVSNSNNEINSTVGLEKGQVVNGEVIDVKYNDVGIKLEDGRILSGKLEDAMNISIGDKVSFQVEDVSLKNLVLKIISESQSINIQSTIDKALDAAGLSKTKLNQTIVKELLNQQMPVDKKTIALLIQQSLSNKAIPVSTLVLMSALHIPATKENINLFESFINKNYNIMNDINTLAEQIPELFSIEDNESTESNLLQSKELLTLVLKDFNSTISNNINIINKEMVINKDMLVNKDTLVNKDILANKDMVANKDMLVNNNMVDDTQLNNQILNGTNMTEAEITISLLNTNTQIDNLEFTNTMLSTQPNIYELKSESTNPQLLTGTILSQAESTNTQMLTGNILSQAERGSLVNYIKDTPELRSLFSEEQLTAISNGTADVREIGFILNQSIETSDYSTSYIKDLFEQVPSASIILSEYQNMQYQDNSIKTFLPQNDRTNLIHLLDNFSLPKDLKEQIQSGSISSKDLLEWISSNLESSTDRTLVDLVSSKEFKSLIKEAFLNKWTFSPQSLKETDMDKYFQNLANQINELKEYMEQTQKGLHENVIKQTNNLQDNVSFMKTINDIFTYVPLPLKLHNQNAHGELYVYTKKKSGRTAADGISVLLHLDMDNLGPTDIHINLKGNNIISKFYFDDIKTVEFIETSISQLENVLEQKGYSVKTEILMKEKEINIVEEFINQNPATSTVSRYNFDVRA